jgi:hypothetical protein
MMQATRVVAWVFSRVDADSIPKKDASSVQKWRLEQ